MGRIGRGAVEELGDGFEGIGRGVVEELRDGFEGVGHDACSGETGRVSPPPEQRGEARTVFRDPGVTARRNLYAKSTARMRQMSVLDP